MFLCHGVTSLGAYVGDGEISPRQAVGGAVTSRAMPALQLETSAAGNKLVLLFYASWKSPENTFISAYLLLEEFEKSQVLFSVVLL